MRHRLYLFFLFCMLAACQDKLPLPDSTHKPEIALLGELVANDSIRIRAGQSIQLGVTPELLKSLLISLKDSSGMLLTILNERTDGRMYELYTVPFSNPTIIEAGRKYNIEAKHPELGNVSASVTIPAAFTAAVAGKDFSDYNGDSVLSIGIGINDPGSTLSNYVVEVFKRMVNLDLYFYHNGNRYPIRPYQYLYDSLKNAGLPPAIEIDTSYSEEYRRQTFYINDEIDGAGDRLIGRYFMSGARFTGPAHKTSVLIPRRFIYGENGQHAQTIIFVKSVAVDYYDFLKAYDAVNGNAEPGSNNIPQQLPCNVIDGRGFLGGVYQWRFEMVY